MQRVDGAPYLHTLIAMVPTAATAGYYADKAVLRRLIEAVTRIVQMGCQAGQVDVDEVSHRAQAAVCNITERRTRVDSQSLDELLEPTSRDLTSISSTGGAATGVPTGFRDLDSRTNGLQPGRMITVAGRARHGKPTIGICRSCSIDHGLTSAIFSLEMISGKRAESDQQKASDFSRNMKLLAKEMKVPFVAISRFNYGAEQRVDRRPMLSDLCESGSIEQDRNLVIMVNRSNVWDHDDLPAGETHLILAKHPGDLTATITIEHRLLHYSRLINLASTSDYPPPRPGHAGSTSHARGGSPEHALNRMAS